MVWLIGYKGMLGSDVEGVLAKSGIDYTATDADVDIANIDALRLHIREANVSWIINCAAYTAVDKAEDEQERAFLINGEGVKNIATVAREKNAVVIHISTDYVFDGLKKDAYRESDRADPRSVYGKSKLSGESHIVNILCQYYILRTSWLFGKKGNNFVYTMLGLFNTKDTISVVSDQRGSPTFTEDLASLIIHIIRTNAGEFGIYHYSNEGATTWFEFAREIYAKAKSSGLINRNVAIEPISTSAYGGRAQRPLNSVMSKEKIKSVFNISIPTWDNALDRFLAKIK
jgi:dTDP-4-dehydrorhamnose reductase